VRSRITTGLQALALAAAIAVFLGVVHRHYPIQRWLFWHYLRVAVLAGFWASACASAGCFLAARLRLARCARGADLVLAFPLGVLAFELAIFLLGLAGWLGPATFVLLPAVCLLVGAGHLLHLARAWPRRPPARNLVELALIGFGVLGVGILYFQILSPAPFSWDARWYHLPIAQQYAMQGAVRPFPEGWWLGAYPHGASLVYTWAFLLPLAGQFDKLELCAHLELAVFLATIASIPALVRLLVPGTSARLAWITIFLFPGIFLYDGNLGAGADHMAALWCIPLALAFARFWRSWSLRDGLLLGAFAAAILLAKYSAWGELFFPAFAVSVRAAWLLLRKRGGSRRRVLAVFGATAGSALVLSAPHWLKNLIWYGDPLFPILHGWLKVHPWAAESPAMFRTFVSFTFPPAPGMKGITDALLSTLTFSFVPNDWWSYHHDVPVFGSLFTLTLLCLPWLRAPARLYLAYLGTMATLVAWYLMNHQDRLLQAWLPVMAGATGATLIMLWREPSLLVRGLVVVLVGAQLVWGGDVPFFPTHNIAYDSPLRINANFLASGFLGTPARLRPYGVVGEIGESLPPDAVVLLHEIQLETGLGRRVVRDSWQGRISYPELATPLAIYDMLRGLGVTHLWWDTDNMSGWNSIASDLAFMRFALNFAVDPVRFDRYTVAGMPSAPPSAVASAKVAMLACRGPYAAGWYELADLVTPEPGHARALPRAPLGELDQVVEQAGFLVVDPACHGNLPQAVEQLYRRPFTREGRKLYVRKL